MKISTRMSCFASALVAMLALTGVSRADVIQGTIWTNQAAYPNPLTSTPPISTPAATFTASSFDFSVPSNGNTTIAGFLASGSGTGLTCAVAGCGSLTNLNDVYEFTGTVDLTAGQTYSFTHDDGMYLYLDGVAYISSGAPTTGTAAFWATR